MAHHSMGKYDNDMHWGKSHTFTDFVDTQLEDLQTRFGMKMWFLTRQRDDDWLLLNIRGDGYDLERGTVLHGPDNPGQARILEHGPLIYPTLDDPSLAPVVHASVVRACVGLALRDHSGHPFGNLCALDPHPQPHLNQPEVRAALRRQCHLLEIALVWNLAGLDQQRIAEFFEESNRDPETELLDATGWARVLDRERQRCADYGLNAVILRLYGASLNADQRTMVADSIAALIRQQDMAAYLGDNQFAVLLTENTLRHAIQVRQRLLDALNAKGVLMRCDPETLRLTNGLMQPQILSGGAVH